MVLSQFGRFRDTFRPKSAKLFRFPPAFARIWPDLVGIGQIRIGFDTFLGDVGGVGRSRPYLERTRPNLDTFRPMLTTLFRLPQAFGRIRPNLGGFDHMLVDFGELMPTLDKFGANLAKFGRRCLHGAEFVTQFGR